MQTRALCFSRARLLVSMAGVALVAALALAAGIVAAHPVSAWANTGYTATATPYYRNPATGVIEDSGGEASEVLGQSMTEGCVSSAAFLEIDDAGNRYVTLRLGLMDNINNVNILADDDWTNTYYQCSPQTIAVDGATTDFRFLVGSEGAIFRINMYVIPMGREVIFYVALSNFVEGNAYGFYEEGSAGSAGVASAGVGASAGATSSAATPSASATPSAASSASQQLKAKIAEAEAQLSNSTKPDDANEALQTALDAAKAVQDNADATDDERKAAADALGDALTTFKNTISPSSVADSADGIAEYDANGNRVSEGEDSGNAVTGIPASTLAAGGVLLAVIVAGIVWFLAYYRPRHAGGASAAAAAAAAPAEGAFRPYEAGPAVLPEEDAGAQGAAGLQAAAGSDSARQSAEQGR